MSRTARSSIPRPLAFAVTALAAVALAWPLAQNAAAGPAEPEAPSTIRVEAGHKLFLLAHAAGVQIYRCDPAGDAYAWRLVAPRADLYDSHGTRIATHFAGPTWKANDGSSVMGRRVDGVNVDPTAIDWLLLQAHSPVTGADGGDRLTHTSYIQRINTAGGRAPAATDCTAETTGVTAEVPYTADYAFWKPRGS
jgi:hypothetical protein